MRIQLASADIKSPGLSFDIRLPNGLAPSFPSANTQGINGAAEKFDIK
jgi:hypothetical protein